MLKVSLVASGLWKIAIIVLGMGKMIDMTWAEYLRFAFIELPLAVLKGTILVVTYPIYKVLKELIG